MTIHKTSYGEYPYSYRAEKWHPHNKILRLVGSNKKVLDVGCAEGYLAEKLKTNGCHVVGIEVKAGRAARAKLHCDSVLIGDVEKVPKSSFPEGFFDVIVYADVLEHTTRPDLVLQRQQSWLARNGYIIVSLPNVAFLTMRLQLLFGRFDYKEFGILDQTHLRFFTLKLARILLKEAQYRIIRTEYTGRLSLYPPFLLFPSLFACGFIFQAVPEKAQTVKFKKH